MDRMACDIRPSTTPGQWRCPTHEMDFVPNRGCALAVSVADSAVNALDPELTDLRDFKYGLIRRVAIAQWDVEEEE